MSSVDVAIENDTPINTYSNKRRYGPLMVAGLGIVSLIGILAVSMSSNHVAVPTASASDVNGIKQLTLQAKSADFDQVCNDPKYSKTMLKTAKETSIVALLADNRGEKKFEASGIIKVANFFYVVFDNLYAIGRFATRLPFNSEDNVLVGEMGSSSPSGYEELVHDKDADLFYLIKEAVTDTETNFRSVIYEVKMKENSTTYDIKGQCMSEFEFESDNKGFEGAAGVRKNGEFYLLGLCEGNWCAAGSKGREKGHGQIKVMKKRERDEGCVWITEHTIDIPPEADFQDYSALSLHHDGHGPTNLRVAVTSQESSQVWFGRLDTDTWGLTHDAVYNFPRDANCNVQYCNIEGIHFLNDEMLAAVSDKMKSGGRQSYTCLDKDQSLHVFVLP